MLASTHQMFSRQDWKRQVKVGTFSSVGAKLFYYMSTLVLISVGLNSYQSARTFINASTKQAQDDLAKDAEKSGGQFEAVIETWKSQIAVTLPTMRGLDAKSSTETLQRFVDSNPDVYLAFQMYSAPDARSPKLELIADAFTSNVGNKYFEDKEPQKVRQIVKNSAIQWLTKDITSAKRDNATLDGRGRKDLVRIESLAQQTELPIVTMAVRFSVDGASKVLWAVLTAWQHDLIKVLPKSNDKTSAVIDAKGRIFTSPDPKELVSRPMSTAKPLVKSATSGLSPSGFEKEYRDAKNRRRWGAFARVSRYNLAVLVEQDAEVMHRTVYEHAKSTALYSSLFVLGAVMFSFLGATGITKGLRAVAFATGRIASGDFKYQIPAGSRDEVGVLGVAINNMARKITDLMQSQVEKARFEKELETAKMVQSTFFPRQDISNGNLAITGFYTPASECGGDLWGHFPIADGVDFLFIADVMGHGAPAALVTAIAYSTTMTIADLIKHDASQTVAPGALLSQLNRIIFQAVQGRISMTFFASIIDLNKGVMTYANAGHNFPVIIPEAATDSRAGKQKTKGQGVATRQAVSLKLMGTPLGMDLASTYGEKTIDLKGGDKLFYFTDGLIECVNPKGEGWGRKHMLEQVVAAAANGPEVMKDTVVKKAFEFFGGVPLKDDVTIVVAEINRHWVPKPDTASTDSTIEPKNPFASPPPKADDKVQAAPTAAFAIPYVPPAPKHPLPNPIAVKGASGNMAGDSRAPIKGKLKLKAR